MNVPLMALQFKAARAEAAKFEAAVQRIAAATPRPVPNVDEALRRLRDVYAEYGIAPGASPLPPRRG